MESISSFDCFSQRDWSPLIDRYLTQHPHYEHSQALLLAKTTYIGKKGKKKKPAVYNPATSKDPPQQFTLLLHKACEHAIKYRIFSDGEKKIRSSLDLSRASLAYFAYNLPQKPLWIELETPSRDKIGGVFFYRLYLDYKSWLTSQEVQSMKFSTINAIQRDEGRWTLEVMDIHGFPTMSLTDLDRGK